MATEPTRVQPHSGTYLLNDDPHNAEADQLAPVAPCRTEQLAPGTLLKA